MCILCKCNMAHIYQSSLSDSKQKNQRTSPIHNIIKEHNVMTNNNETTKKEIRRIKNKIISNNKKILRLHEANIVLDKKLGELLKNEQTPMKNNVEYLENKEENKITKNSNDDVSKNEIIELFMTNVRGKKYIKNNAKNDGDEGHWLEKNMHLSLNSNNAPDIGGYEMKKDSKKISFGDWSAEYLFSAKRKLLEKINGNDIKINRDEFIKNFGNLNEDNVNRYSWSGSCIPKYGSYNNCGQKLIIDEENNIQALYSYEHDKRDNKKTEIYKDKIICIAVWSKEKMERHVNAKFNQKGFFVCKKNMDGVYEKICFGMPISYEMFIEKIKSGDIFFDSGMYHDSINPNPRQYSQWRACQKFWHNLLIEEY